MSDQKFRLRACLWYEFKQGKSAAEAHRALSQVFDKDALSESQCKRWFQRFRDGDESLEDQKHGSRPQIIDNDALKEAIDQAIDSLRERWRQVIDADGEYLLD
ncbi:unnamed protein product, partial [Mesorhabditis belari]|uniref:Mos1 transposase HTH domain-containing protein n=1 Tax=Mesorhabditis belari TaxID=2138241 RepID=A0AAF3EKV7_9BILA